MPITAETFRIEHFEHLTRGLEAAHGAFEQLQEQVDEAREAERQAAASASALETELMERPSPEAWDELIELIEDVGRDVRTLDELLDYVKRNR